MKGHNPENLAKGQGISLKLHRRMGHDIINIITHNTFKNKPIKVIKNNQILKGGRVLERVDQRGEFLKVSGKTK